MARENMARENPPFIVDFPYFPIQTSIKSLSHSPLPSIGVYNSTV
jgi:hypothetical protein